MLCILAISAIVATTLGIALVWCSVFFNYEYQWMAAGAAVMGVFLLFCGLIVIAGLLSELKTK